MIGTQAACSCLPDYVGQSPNCRPECTISAECPSSLACIKEKCRDPCSGSCGLNAHCNVLNHNAVCICIIGYEGDPTVQCNPIPVTRKICSLDAYIFFLQTFEHFQNLPGRQIQRLARLHLVVRTLSVENKTEQEHASALMAMKAILLTNKEGADENAKLTANVPINLLALETNVLILALVHAAHQHYAK